MKLCDLRILSRRVPRLQDGIDASDTFARWGDGVRRLVACIKEGEILMIVRAALVIAVIVAPLSLAHSQGAFPSKCPDGASLPFAKIEVSHPIDSSCSRLTGDPSVGDPSHLQNAVKNNFCATPLTPETYNLQQLVKLQADAVEKHVSFGFEHEPTSRDVVHSLGEGTLIRVKASLIEAHFADVPDGESVNCYKPNNEDNDIHIALGLSTDTEECSSVSAEISPHYRPETWSSIGDFETQKSKKYIPNPAIASRLQAATYRITGQLFFDGSHKPCTCDITKCNGNPRRATNWEIHPVYNIEVCRAGTACDENDDNDWLAFDTWWKHLSPAHVPPVHEHPKEKE